MASLTSTLLFTLTDRVTGPARGVAGALNQLDRRIDALNRSQIGSLGLMRGIGGRLLAYGGAYVGVTQGIRQTAGAAIDLESAMADVRKVVDVSDEAFANMRRDVIGLSKEMPTAATGIAAIYAAAAQSDVAQRDLKGFAEGVIRVSTAWETSVDTTSESLAKIKTALGRDLKGTFALADAINHISNVSAASAPDLLEYENRVAAFAETAGFSAEQALAFGGAMVGSGFEPEVAATSFRNLTKALTIGTKATKAQRQAFKTLGLDSVKVAKRMQTDAVGATLDTLDAIKKLPEWQQISIASALFGDEARGLAPLFRDATELRRLLGETGDAAKYAGSAFEEYRRRAATTGNQLQIVKNNVSALGIALGDAMLRTINAGLSGLLDLFETAGERSGAIDAVTTSLKGFAAGLGYTSGDLSAMVGDLRDFLFGAEVGLEIKVRLDAGAKVIDWRAFQKNPGQ